MNVISYAGMIEALGKASRLAKRIRSGAKVSRRSLEAFCRIVDAAVQFNEPGEYRLLLQQDDGSWRLSHLGPWDRPLAADAYGDIHIGREGYKVVCIVES